MSSPAEWLPDGTPHPSSRHDTHSSPGPSSHDGLPQVHHVLLQGCGLLAAEKQAKLPHTASHASNTAWASQPQWHVLDTHFGRGLNFLATWAAWRADPQRPARLFFTSITAQPPSADELRRSARAFADLGGPAEAKQLPAPSADMIDALTAQWHTLLPGLHRLVFEGGAVQLTLCVGARAMRAANAAHGAGLSGAEGVASAADAAGAVDAADATNDLRTLLRELDVAADSIFLTHSSPDPSPALRDLPTLKSVARLARRGTRLATCDHGHDQTLAHHLQQCGFVSTRCPGPAPDCDGLAAEYAPPWAPRHLGQLRQPLPASTQPERHAVVVGAGISGASVAASLAERGWRVTVLDAAPTPASGASGLPAGIFAPHVSPDDGRLAQLTRAGLRAMHRCCETVLTRGQDWAPTGVLELPVGRERRLPADWLAHAAADEATRTETGAEIETGLGLGTDVEAAQPSSSSPHSNSNRSMGTSPPNSRREPPHTANKSQHPGLDSSRPAQATDAPTWQADLAKQRSALASAPLWHLQAGWVRPAQLVRALLSQPGIRWRGGCQVARAEAMAHPPQQAGEPGTSPATNPSTQHHRWQVFNESGVLLECCDLLVLAAGPATAQLLARWATPEQFPTHQVHGLVTVGDMAHWPKRPDWVDQPDRPGAPSHAQQPTDSPAHRAGSTPPVNGHGSLLCDIPGLQRSAAPAAGTGTAKIGTHSTDTHHAVGTGNTTGETTRKTTAASGASSANSETGANNANGESSASGANSANSHFWCTGASFLRSLPRGFDAATIAAEHQANALRLAELLPVTAAAVRQQIRAGQVWHWHGTRCTVADRVPLVGPLLGLHGLQAGADRKAQPVGKHTPSGATRPQTSAPAPWVCTALGARGMTLGVLCGELLAAWVHGEPLPLASSLAAKLQASRFMADGHTAA